MRRKQRTLHCVSAWKRGVGWTYSERLCYRIKMGFFRRGRDLVEKWWNFYSVGDRR